MSPRKVKEVSHEWEQLNKRPAHIWMCSSFSVSPSGWFKAEPFELPRNKPLWMRKSEAGYLCLRDPKGLMTMPE